MLAVVSERRRAAELSHLLRATGLAVTVADRGSAALLHLEAGATDLIVIDLALADARPSGDNAFKIELARRIVARALMLALAGTPDVMPALPASPFSTIPGMQVPERRIAGSTSSGASHVA